MGYSMMKTDEIPDEIELERELGSRSLYDFTRLAWPHVEPDQPFIDSWHISALTEHYEACLRGEIDRLVVNLPPGMSKSRITCVFFPTFSWIGKPGLRFLNASFDSDLTMRDASDSLDLMQSKWFRQRWGNRFVLPSPSPVGNIRNNVGGWRYATSTGGKALGRHADIQIIDDPTKPKGMTRESLDETRKWLQNTMASRWRKPGLNCRLLIMQRLHVADLAATMLEDGAVHLCLPMEFEPKRKCMTQWFEDPRTEKGELLCPARFDKKAVGTMRREMTGQVAAAQLGQDPVPEGGAVFKLDWFRYWKVLPASLTQMVVSVDCSFKGTDDSDFVVMQCWGRRGGEFWLIDQVKGKWTFSQTLAELRKFCRKHPKATKRLIEDKANGTAVIDTLKKEVSGMVPVNPEGGKVARANAVQPFFEANNVFIPDPKQVPWVDTYTTEMCNFPMGANDDQVDTTTQALLHLHQARSYLKDAMDQVANAGEEDP